MSKEAYYFSHDSNARNDEKILAVRMKLGAEGYGIYFMILERLRDDSEHMSIKDYNILAFDFRVGADKVKSVIEDFNLFEFTEVEGKAYFYSKRMFNNMKLKNEKSEKARESANLRWSKSEGNANALQPQSEGNAIKERKGKERKEYSSRSNDQSNPKISFKKQTKEDFYEELKPLVSDYGKETIKEFFAYWTEPSANGTLKYQLEKTWDTSRRLQNWKRNESKFGVSTIPKQPKQIPGPWAS